MKHIVLIDFVSSGSVFTGNLSNFLCSSKECSISENVVVSIGKGGQHEAMLINNHHLKGGKDHDLKGVIHFSLFPELGSVSAFSFQIL